MEKGRHTGEQNFCLEAFINLLRECLREGEEWKGAYYAPSMVWIRLGMNSGRRLRFRQRSSSICTHALLVEQERIREFFLLRKLPIPFRLFISIFIGIFAACTHTSIDAHPAHRYRLYGWKSPGFWIRFFGIRRYYLAPTFSCIVWYRADKEKEEERRRREN